MPKSDWSGPPLFSCFQARTVLAAIRSGKVRVDSSLDLGRTACEMAVSDAGAASGEIFIPADRIIAIAREERKVFRLDREPLEAIKVFSAATGWVRSLCPTASAPTVLVGGFPMHRIKGTDPMRDTLSKIRALGKAHGRVLDTATGLGYTAIELARTASEVVTVELDPGAWEIARMNPWSCELFSMPNITQQRADVAEAVTAMSAGSFEAVMHDPPTLSLGGELYGLGFYKEVHRVLRRGGRLFHYLGDPESGAGRKLMPGVMRRLQEAGFKRIERHPAAFGVTAVAG